MRRTPAPHAFQSPYASASRSVVASSFVASSFVARQFIAYVELSRQGRRAKASAAFGDTLVAAGTTGPGGETEKMSARVSGHDARFLAVSFALVEQILRTSHLDVGKSHRWTAFRLGAGDTTSLTATRFHADSAVFAMPDVQLKVAISATGEVVGGRHLGQEWLIERRGTP